MCCFFSTFSGVKFKLVKSNSCSSRLELTGTLPRDQNKLPITPEPPSEESVRELVNRLEVGTSNQASVPRIIESKCIEKINQSIPEELTINNQHFETKSNQNDHEDYITHVTVNNHITLKTPSKHKIQRNKNVDLAYQSTTKAPVSSKPVKEMENIAKQNLPSQHNHQTFEEAKEMFTTAFDNISKAEDRLKDEQQASANTTNSRLIKWESMNTKKFDEKFFISNDQKLKEQKKYDEMEFEEFEVYDPRHECYDSLNSVTATESK